MEYLCKLIGTTQATCVFFSAFSIVLIAVDRYLFIVHPTSTQISTRQVSNTDTTSGDHVLLRVKYDNIEFLSENEKVKTRYLKKL